MKRFIKIFTPLLLAFPVFLFAANDVTLTTSDAQIVANDITLKISGSHNVDSITVNSGSFDVVLSQSTLVVTSADRKKITASPTTYTTSFVCGSSESTLTLERNAEGTDTVTVTPSSDTCSGGGGGSAGGGSSSVGGGGGGGGGGAAVVTALPTTTPAPSVAQPSAVAQAVSPVFNTSLHLGMTHADVKRLQQLLNSDSDTQIAASGVGSAGNESSYFGSLTAKAVQKFQEKYGVAKAGDPGYGDVGPKTRAKLQEVFSATPATPAVPGVAPAIPATPAAPAVGAPDKELSQIVELFIALGIIPADKAEQARSVLSTSAAPSAPAGVSGTFTSGMGLGTSNADVKRLQQLLNSDPDTQIASAGVGSSGNESQYFGKLTEDAVKKFQKKHGIASEGDSGYGFVGPKTRTKLDELY